MDDLKQVKNSLVSRVLTSLTLSKCQVLAYDFKFYENHSLMKLEKNKK